jgi:hypothetical protein
LNLEVTMADFEISGGGTVYLVTPLNQAAQAHLEAVVSSESQWLGRSLACEHRYIVDLVNDLRGNWFSVQ